MTPPNDPRPTTLKECEALMMRSSMFSLTRTDDNSPQTPEIALKCHFVELAQAIACGQFLIDANRVDKTTTAWMCLAMAHLLEAKDAVVKKLLDMGIAAVGDDGKLKEGIDTPQETPPQKH